ncbi:hypothetical protein [uncultured Campylobacter sp.]|uniref:hypothetical protein n=1 Tax=uncultured Campylobacter sp. TaxID=218934 RepID=UPI0026157945|nr:hypothetical protein [uncultured Campylobacter sp.]
MVIVFIPGFIVFCIAKAFLEGLTSSVNNRFIASVVPIVGGLVLGYLAGASVYESEQAKDAEREVQKQQNMTQQDKVYYIQRSLMFSGYGVTIDGKWGKKLYKRHRNIRARPQPRSMSFMKRSRLKKRAEDKI